MVAKVLGLASGALVASVAVWAFNDWRHVSDDDMLMTALSDHCIPYVLNGDIPFEDMGRPVGVYDDAFVDDRMENGGAKIVFDARFVASWGDIDATQNLRVCRVDGRPMGASRQSFDVERAGFLARISDAVRPLGDLQPDADRMITMDEMFQTISWTEPDAAPLSGNRAVLSVVQSRVANLIVVNDLTD